MRTRKIVRIRLRRNKRARKAQRLQNIKYCIIFSSMFTMLLTWGLMTSTVLN